MFVWYSEQIKGCIEAVGSQKIQIGAAASSKQILFLHYVDNGHIISPMIDFHIRMNGSFLHNNTLEYCWMRNMFSLLIDYTVIQIRSLFMI